MTTEYTLTKIRTFNGREGQGLNATICRNGVAVACVMDDASGGQVDIDFTNPLQTPASYNKSKDTWRAQETDCLAFALTWYLTSPDAKTARDFDAELDAKYPNSRTRAERTERQRSYSALESWVNVMVEQHAEDKQLRRWSKTQTCFRLKGDPQGEWRTLKAPISDPRVMPTLTQRYGDKIERVYQP